MTSTTLRGCGARAMVTIALTLAVATTGSLDSMMRDGPFATAAAQDESPQWRGPNRDGKSASTGLAAKWNKGGPPVQWNVRVGLGFSAPAVEGGVVYVTGHLGNEVQLVTLDLKTGKLKWAKKVGDAGKGGGPAYVGARGTPAIDCNAAYVLGDLGIWSSSTRRRARSCGGSTSSPISRASGAGGTTPSPCCSTATT